MSMLGAGCYRDCSWCGEAARPDGLRPRGTCAAPGCLWLWLRMQAGLGSLSSAAGHSEPVLFFSVGPPATYSCTTRFAPGMRERRCVGAGASTADQSDDVGRRPFVGCPNADAPPVIANEREHDGGLDADDKQRRRRKWAAVRSSRAAREAEAPRITSSPDGATPRWPTSTAAPAPRFLARARARAG